MGYISFETTSYLSTNGLHWDGNAKQYIIGKLTSMTISCKKLTCCGYVNPACLELFNFTQVTIPSTLASEFQTYSVTTTNYQALGFVGSIFDGGNNDTMRVAVPSVRGAFFLNYGNAGKSNLILISSTASDASLTLLIKVGTHKISITSGARRRVEMTSVLVIKPDKWNN
jgi:hypothetical protein